MLGLIHSKFITGCSSLQGQKNLDHFQNTCQQVMSLEEMLKTPFRTDSHFTCYNITDYPAWPRLNKPILPEIRLEGHDIVLAYFAFDWDNADHAEWSTESLQRFCNLLITCQDPVISSWTSIYTTKHGARIIYKISKPVPVDDGEHHLAWMLHHFKEHDLDLIDDSCKDWTRLMRCPRVMRDNVPTWEQDYFEEVYQENILDINLVGKRSPKTVANKILTPRDIQDMPSHDILESQRYAENRSTGKTVETAFYKRAKKALKGSDYYDILIMDAAPGWGKGDRNNQILLMIGKVVPVLLKGTKGSMLQLFSLIVQPLLTMDNDQDWLSHGWNALQDIYNREVNKFNKDQEAVADKVSREIDLLDKMVEGMKTWCDDPALTGDEEVAREFVRENALASVKGYFYAMGEDGFYINFPITQSQVVSRIRRTHMRDLIETKKINYTGEAVDVNSTAIQNEFSSPISEIQMRPVGEMGGHFENINGNKPVLVMSTFARNSSLVPTFNTYVNDWLKHLFGNDFEKGCAWIGNALAFEEGLICALSLEGASAAGKKLLSIGLSECLKDPYIATPDDIYGQSSAFLRTPFLVVDESWPTGMGKVAPADKFKSLTGGDGMTVNEKFMPQIRILCPVRIILTANDECIVKALMQGKSMGLDNRIAVGERLFHLKVSARAAAYLRSIGGRGFTGRSGQRWIRPDAGSEKSDFVVAKHFLWLYKNREPVDPSQRFLVMGNQSPGVGDGAITVVERLLADNNHTPVISRAIIEMVETGGTAWRKYIYVDHELTCLKVTRNGIYKYIRNVMEERISEGAVLEGLQNLTTAPEPELINSMHWYDIDVAVLSMVAQERGIEQTVINQIYVNRIAKGLSK